MFTDMILSSDRGGWRIIEDKLSKARLGSKPTQNSFRFTKRGGKSIRVKNDTIYPSDENKNTVERLDNIRHFCDESAWNVFNNDSYTFIFSTYKIWDKLVCSLSDIDLNSTYEHVCQYGS